MSYITLYVLTVEIDFIFKVKPCNTVHSVDIIYPYGLIFVGTFNGSLFGNKIITVVYVFGNYRSSPVGCGFTCTYVIEVVSIGCLFILYTVGYEAATLPSERSALVGEGVAQCVVFELFAVV